MANRMTVTQKQEALQNALNYYGFAKGFFIQVADKRLGHKFAIASNKANGGIHTSTNFMTYDEFNAYLIGYSAGKEQFFAPRI